MRQNRKKNPAEKPVIVLTKVPKPPREFSKPARALWREVCHELIGRRLLTDSSRYTVEQFVSLTLASREAMRDKKVSYAQKLSLVREARLLGESLGFSPSAQAKVQPPTGVISDNADDQLFAEIVA